MQTIYKKDTTVIGFNLKYKILRLSWQQYVSSDKYWAVMTKFLRLTHELQAKGWLIDASESDNIDMEVAALKIREISEVLKNTRLRKVARIISPDLLFEAKLNAICSQTYEGILYRFFSNEAEALAWLKS